MSFTTTVTTTYKCFCGLTVILQCENCKILEKRIDKLEEDNHTLTKKLDIVETELTEIKNLEKIRQIGVDLMEFYINSFSNNFNIEEIDITTLFNERKSINKNELVKFDKEILGNYTFLEFNKAIKSMKKFNTIAHPAIQYKDIENIQKLIDENIKNKKNKEIISYVLNIFEL